MIFFSHSNTKRNKKCLFFVIQPQISKSLDNTYILTGLKPGTRYTIQVATVTSFGSSPFTISITPVTDNEEFTVIENLKKILGINGIKKDIKVIKGVIKTVNDDLENKITSNHLSLVILGKEITSNKEMIISNTEDIGDSSRQITVGSEI